MSEEKDRVDGTADETKAETKSSDHHTEDTYEKVCFMCRRPESKAGKMITLPGNINICPDCMQKSFDTMNQNPGQINEMMNNMNNMPNIGMFDLSGLSNQIPNRQRVKKKEERIMNNGCVPPTASHFNQVSCSGKKHSGQSNGPVLFAPPRAAHRHYSLFIIIYYFYKGAYMIDKERLAQKCSTWNIVLSGAQLDLLDRYAEILVDYNQKVNLTAITSPEGIEDRHFADSLLFAAQPEVSGRLVDVGTGAGFPGIVAKIYKPDLELTLMEPTGKRVDFLRYACAELGLTGVEFAKERAEEAARKVWREQFDVASARAVAALPVLCEYCLPLVRVGGVFIAMKGPDADAELGGSAAALKKLGGAYGDTRAFTLPDGSERRLVVCKKISQTPTAYPRNGGKIAKKPL